MSRRKQEHDEQLYQQWVDELGLRDMPTGMTEDKERMITELLARVRANSIRQRRIERKMRMSDLADMLGVSVSTISAYERGITSPTIARLKEIARIFDCSLTEISQINWEAKRVRRGK